MLAAASLASTLRHEVEEEQARIFFERAYQRAYLRLMIIVSGLYQLYDGKQTYFWKAQQLTERDYYGVAEIHEAFRHIVSGLEDQRDSTRSNDRLMHDTERNAVKYQLYDSVFRPFSIPPEIAGNGHFLCMKPRLGLSSTRANTG